MVLQRRPPGSEPQVWLVVVLAHLLATIVGDLTDAPRVSCFTIGLAAGTAWQLAQRRDLADRLVVLACLFLLVVTITLVGRDDFVAEDMNTTGLFFVGVVIALVFTEQWLRRRDRLATKAASSERSRAESRLPLPSDLD